MNWYLIHTKPRQEKCALFNLERQGYECYMPVIFSEKLRQGSLVATEEPLFPRYIFIRLGTGENAKSWIPIRSTKGVSRLVSFGVEPAKVDERLVETIRAHQNVISAQTKRFFTPGERVVVKNGAFAGIEAIYQMPDGNRRVVVLIEFLSKPVRVSLSPVSLRKVG